MSKLISVIVPVYNAQKYLERCINCLVNQTYKNLEIILVNDGSTDSSPEICEYYKRKYQNIKVIHKNNGGVASARNAGLNLALGAYIGFMDNDDYIESDMYEVLEKILSENEDTLIVQSLVDDVNENGYNIMPIQYQKEYVEKIDAKTFRIDLLLQRANMTCWSKLFRRKVLQKYQFINGRWNEDFLLLYRILLDVPYILSINKVGYHYVHRKGSYSNAGFNQGIIDNVVNSKWALDLAVKNESNVVEYAIRLYFHQMIPYLLFIPMGQMNSNNELYIQCSIDLKKYNKEWNNNPYLRKKEKLILKVMMTNPRMFRNVLKIINYKGYYTGW